MNDALPGSQPPVEPPPAGVAGPAPQRTRQARIEPVSFGQERLWFLDQLEPGNHHFCETGAARLALSLNLALLERAFNEIIRRHEALRTNIATVDGRPVQVVHPARTISVKVVDLADVPAGRRQQELEQLINRQARQGFDLANDLLTRATLVRVRHHEQVLIVTQHHAITDGLSMRLLVHELFTLYHAFSKGRPPALPPVPAQYADYARWQGQQLTGQTYANSLNWWKTRLAGATQLDLATDHPRPANPSYAGAVECQPISKPLADRVRELARREGVTLFMALLAAYEVLLARYSGQVDLVVGTPVSDRSRPEFAALLGFFVNIVVLRVNLDGDPTVRELLARVREACLQAWDHQQVPFERLVQELRPTRIPGQEPLCQTSFALQPTMPEVAALPGLSMATAAVDRGISKYAISLGIDEQKDGSLVAAIEFQTELFERSTVVRMARHYIGLLEEMADSAQRPISELRMLTAAESQQAHSLAHGPPRAGTEAIGPAELFEAQAARAPGAVAILHDQAVVTYAALNDRVAQVAHELQALGVGPGVHVGLALPRSPELIAALLAVLKAGGAFVPLDPAHPAEWLWFVMQDSGVRVVLTRAGHPRLRTPPGVHVVELGADWSLARGANRHDLASAARPDDPAYVMYTSGSSGRPRGVVVPRSAITHYVKTAGDLLEVTADDCILQFASLSFDAALEEILPCLARGARLRLRNDQMLSSPAAFLRTCDAWRVTVLDLPTAWWHVLAAALRRNEAAWPEQIRLVVVGGERALADRLRDWWQAVGSRVRLLNTYGPTEATVVATARDLSRWLAERGGLFTGEVPIGTPLPGVQSWVLDRFMQPVPVGVRGELYLGGAGLARGYWNDPAQTALRFVPHPMSAQPGERLYRTGDLCRWLPDGNLEFLGRSDEQIKLRGIRIEPAEIELALRQHPDVDQAVVALRQGPADAARLVAYVVPRGEPPPEPAALREYLTRKLPAPMVPGAFVLLEALPLTPSGKVDRQALPAPAWAETAGSAHAPPRNPVEAALARIWAEALELKRVGVHDNFFELGGDSLRAVGLVARVEAELQVQVPLRTLFDAPTVALLAEQIEQGRRPAPDARDASPRLIEDAVLEAEISPPPRMAAINHPRAVLLTGATGFLGAFLLEEILRQTSAMVYCLVRASNEAAALRRVRQALAQFGIAVDDERSARIVAVAGDLSLPRLGLSASVHDRLAETIDGIYHNGANVNFVLPYEDLRAANVQGTREVLRLACQAQCKSVHLVSTLSVFPLARRGDGAPESGARFSEETRLEDPSGLAGGYAQSKWVAERLVTEARDRGVPATTYRVGRVSPHSQSGVGNPADVAALVMKTCQRLGSLPEISLRLEILPVDNVCRALVGLSLQPGCAGRVYHLAGVQSQLISTRDLLAHGPASGSALRVVPAAEWRQAALNLLGPGLPAGLPEFDKLFGPGGGSLELAVDCQATRQALLEAGIPWLPASDASWHRYIAALLAPPES